MKSVLKTVLLSTYLLVSQANSHAQNVIYDNGQATLSSSGGYSISGNLFTANSFTLTNAVTIQSMSFACYISANQRVASLNWYILSSPFNAASASLFQGSASSLQSTRVYGAGNYEIDEVSFNVSSFTLQPGTYWLALGNALTSGGGRSYWMSDPSANSSKNLFVVRNLGQVGANVYSLSGSAAFRLYGTAAIPEPSSYALLGLGVLVTLVAARRKRA